MRQNRRSNLHKLRNSPSIQFDTWDQWRRYCSRHFQNARSILPLDNKYNNAAFKEENLQFNAVSEKPKGQWRVICYTRDKGMFQKLRVSFYKVFNSIYRWLFVAYSRMVSAVDKYGGSLYQSGKIMLVLLITYASSIFWWQIIEERDIDWFGYI